LIVDERKQREEQMKAEGRLPPRQALTLKWPVLHYGSIPDFDAASWTFHVWEAVEKPLRLSWSEFNALPKIRTSSDFHCVTRWSRFDNTWDGVGFGVIMNLARPLPSARFVMVHAEQGYTANVPLEDLKHDGVLLATHHDGQPLTPEHGYPLRLIVPHLYGWKSVKWVRGFEFMEHDAPGFWEQNGYHMRGDPWKEQRFDSN